ncbi:unnamed protein product, partial [Tenebrio molitor]
MPHADRASARFDLRSANWTIFKVHGQNTLAIDIGLKCADFINHFGLIVDLRAKKLYSQDRAETTNGRVKPTNQFGIRAIFDSGRAFPTIAAKIPGRPS